MPLPNRRTVPSTLLPILLLTVLPFLLPLLPLQLLLPWTWRRLARRPTYQVIACVTIRLAMQILRLAGLIRLQGIDVCGLGSRFYGRRCRDGCGGYGCGGGGGMAGWLGEGGGRFGGGAGLRR